MSDFKILLEKMTAEKEIEYINLPVKVSSLSPVLSEKLMSLHYGALYKNYVNKAKETGDKFQIAGAKLHTLFFEQFQEPKLPNKPFDKIELVIDKKFGNFQKFKEKILENAMSIHGSGWVYLDTSGKIKIIENHEDIVGIVLLIDCWEHAYQTDYNADKEKYIKSFWKIINWDVINSRLEE